MISKLPNLRKRIIAGLIVYTLALSLAVGLNGFIINNNIEKLVWQSVLNIGIENFNQQFMHQDANSSDLYFYDETQGDVIPDVFKGYKVGIHHEIKYKDRLYVIRVVEETPKLKILTLDITELQQQEFRTALLILLLTIISIMLMTWVGYRQLGKLLDPLLILADDLSKMGPLKDHFDHETQHMQYYESYILTHAIQTYVEKSNKFLESEKVFFSTTSHELRTPLSVLYGAVEVLQHHPDVKPTLHPHLQRISNVVEDMEELITCLLFLARDQDRLESYSEQLDLAQLVPTIVENHLGLCEGKKLELVNMLEQSFFIKAPPQLINIIISNLLRNAIENSDSGTIKIYRQQHHVIIEDPGRGMSMEELSSLYTQNAKLGNLNSGGIGIPLILKICEHLGWQLQFQSKQQQGTIAILDIKASTKPDLSHHTVLK